MWKHNLITNESLARCPVRTQQLAHETNPILSAEIDRYDRIYYPAFQSGNLLDKGGSANQPARFFAFMELIASVRDAVDAKYEELTKADGNQ